MVEIQAIIDGVGAVDTVAGSDEYDDSDLAIIGLKNIGLITKNVLNIKIRFLLYNVKPYGEQSGIYLLCEKLMWQQIRICKCKNIVIGQWAIVLTLVKAKICTYKHCHIDFKWQKKSPSQQHFFYLQVLVIKCHLFAISTFARVNK